jgi:hypothetical protein
MNVDDTIDVGDYGEGIAGVELRLSLKSDLRC